jgi:serine/threonine protein kinase
VHSVHKNIHYESSIKKNYKQILKLSSFEITHKIDSGSFSTIYLAKKKGIELALKQMSKDKLLYKGQMKYALTELNVLIKSRPCPYIIPIYYAFQTHDYLYLALKYIPYGNLSRLIHKMNRIS